MRDTGSSRRFPETHWSRLITLRDPSHPLHQKHLQALIELYWTPAYHYVRAVRNMTAEDAEDLVQQFFTVVLSRGDLEKLSPDRGTFRGFLKTALRRFTIDQERRRTVRQPGTTTRLFRFDEAETQVRLRRPGLTPEEAFDREWARSVLSEGLTRLRHVLEIEGKAKHYEVFRRYTLDPDAEATISYESLAKELGLSVDEVRNGLRDVRKRGREILKELLEDYLFPGEDLEGELRFILSR